MDIRLRHSLGLLLAASLMCAARAAEPAATATVTVDLRTTLGPIKPMHAVNNGPSPKKPAGDQVVGNFEEYKAARIPAARIHDAAFHAGYGGEHTVDISAIFPDFEADADDPKSYDFVCTDHYLDAIRRAGTEVFFRLGQKIEHGPKKYGVLPPKDFDKWARICEHVVRHYNEGWGWGADTAWTTQNVVWSNQFNIAYWEIWNEPDLDSSDTALPKNPRTWGGSVTNFFELYEVTAKRLKERFPELKVGGPAIAGDERWAARFLDYCRDRRVPLDFFSWHTYARAPGPVAAKAERMRKLLDARGFSRTESILNEWNYVKGWVNDFVYSLRVESGDLNLKCAAFIAATMVECQSRPVDMLMYYDARIGTSMNGLFAPVTCWPLKGYYPFYLWSKLMDCGTQVACTVTDAPGLRGVANAGGSEKRDHPVSGQYHATAARRADGSGAVLLVRYSDDDNTSEQGEVRLRFQGARVVDVRCLLTDLVRTCTEVPVDVEPDGTVRVRLLPNAFALVEFGGCGAGGDALAFTGETRQGVLVESPGGTAQSFACWVKAEGCGKGDRPYDRIVQTPGWHLHTVAAPDAVSSLTFGYTGKDGKIVSVGDIDPILFGEWQHVAVTYSADGFRIYLNGVGMGLPLTRNLPERLRPGFACLANSAVGGSRPLKGRMAGARFWNRALTAPEVARLAAVTPDGRAVKRPKTALPKADDLLPVVDISGDASRQTVIAEGTKDRYEGHPTTLLADDGRTMFCVWTTGHGGPCGPMARSDDGGRTWRRLDSILPPAYARTHANCPVIQKVKGPDGRTRYFVYSSKAREGRGLGVLMSEDLGRSWVERPCQPQLSAGMPPTGLMELKDGTVALFGQVFKDKARAKDRPTDDQAVWMAISKDGGRTYGEMRRVMEAASRNLCEPCCLRSPDGRSLLLLARENRHRGRSMMAFSHDEGRTWTAPADTPWALTGDRHEGVLLPDGRYVIAFRDQAVGSPTRGQYMAWVGTFDDLLNGRNGQCRIHLLKHHGLIGQFPGGPWDTGYSGVELLPDGTIVCTTYSRHFADGRQSSVVSTRFKISEIDAKR